MHKIKQTLGIKYVSMPFVDAVHLYFKYDMLTFNVCRNSWKMYVYTIYTYIISKHKFIIIYREIESHHGIKLCKPILSKNFHNHKLYPKKFSSYFYHSVLQSF